MHGWCKCIKKTFELALDVALLKMTVSEVVTPALKVRRVYINKGVENLGGTTIIDLSNRPMSNRAIIWTHRTIF